MGTEVLKIVLLHFILLASQAFYMYLSNRKQFRNKKYLYLAALLPVLALPAVFSLLDQTAYLIYEYAIVFCMITAAVADTSYAAARNKEFFTEPAIRCLHYSYFIICLAASFCKGTGVPVKVITSVILAGICFRQCIMKKYSPSEFVRAMPLALLSFACSWAFITYVI